MCARMRVSVRACVNVQADDRDFRAACMRTPSNVHMRGVCPYNYLLMYGCALNTRVDVPIAIIIIIARLRRRRRRALPFVLAI